MIVLVIRVISVVMLIVDGGAGERSGEAERSAGTLGSDHYQRYHPQPPKRPLCFQNPSIGHLGTYIQHVPMEIVILTAGNRETPIF